MNYMKYIYIYVFFIAFNFSCLEMQTLTVFLTQITLETFQLFCRRADLSDPEDVVDYNQA